MKIGLIGAGNMASAIIGTILNKRLVSNNDVYVFDTNIDTQIAFVSKYGVNACSSYDELFESIQIVIIAVKPITLERVLLKSINHLVQKYKPLIISIVAGKSIEFIEENLGFINPIIRVMPNINAAVGASTTAYCYNEHVTIDQKSIFVEYFSSIGLLIDLDENLFGIFCAISSSSPAMSFMYIDAMARAAVKAGMDKKLAVMIAANSVIGSGKSILESGLHSWELVDRVCSPGGTTAETVYSLQKSGFEASVYDAVLAAIQKESNV